MTLLGNNLLPSESGRSLNYLTASIGTVCKTLQSEAGKAGHGGIGRRFGVEQEGVSA